MLKDIIDNKTKESLLNLKEKLEKTKENNKKDNNKNIETNNKKVKEITKNNKDNKNKNENKFSFYTNERNKNYKKDKIKNFTSKKDVKLPKYKNKYKNRNNKNKLKDKKNKSTKKVLYLRFYSIEGKRYSIPINTINFLILKKDIENKETKEENVKVKLILSINKYLLDKYKESEEFIYFPKEQKIVREITLTEYKKIKDFLNRFKYSNLKEKIEKEKKGTKLFFIKLRNKNTHYYINLKQITIFKKVRGGVIVRLKDKFKIDNKEKPLYLYIETDRRLKKQFVINKLRLTKINKNKRNKRNGLKIKLKEYVI